MHNMNPLDIPDTSATVRRPRWPKWALILASLQCLVWGPFMILWPERSAMVYGFAKPPQELFLWQGTGLIILLYGLGYLLAASDPEQHWGLVLIGLLAKTLGPIGMAWSVWQHQVDSAVLVLIPFHDLLWWVPFFLIVRRGMTSRRPSIPRTTSP